MTSSAAPANAPETLSGLPLDNPEDSILRAPVLIRGRIPALSRLVRAGDSLALLSPAHTVRIGSRHFALDGKAICAGTIIAGNSDVEKALPASIVNGSLEGMADWWAAKVVNPSCLFVLDEVSQQAVCLPDPLGGALAFRYTEGGTELISSDVVSLVRVAHQAGLSPRKSIDFQAERLILGNGGFTPASYDGVERLNIFEYWALGETSTVPKEYALAEEMRRTDVSYVEVMEKLRQQVLESVTAISTMPSEYRVAHLTGGFDSRLVLSAMVEAGCTDQFNYFCSGPQGTVDRVISDDLMETFGLPRGASGGLTTAPTKRVSERLLAPLFYSGGMIPTGPTGRELPSSVVASGGGYGEVLRTFYGPRFKELDHANFTSDDLMRHLVPKLRGREGIFTDETRSAIGSRVHDEWLQLKAKGEPDDFIGDALYSHVRNRYHIGQGSLLWSRIGARFDPLYSVYGYQIARALPLEARESNVIGFDLMDSFAGNLRAYPFDRNRFSATYASMRRIPTPVQGTSGPMTVESRTFTPRFSDVEVLPPRLAGLQVEDPQATSAQRKEFVAKANKIGVNYWQVAALSKAQNALGAALESVDYSILGETVNIGYIRRLSSGRLERRQEVRAVYFALGLIGWLGE